MGGRCDCGPDEDCFVDLVIMYILSAAELYLTVW